ncbi:hypothetical protein Tco_0348967 [Tanacetum coccineum]
METMRGWCMAWDGDGCETSPDKWWRRKCYREREMKKMRLGLRMKSRLNLRMICLFEISFTALLSSVNLLAMDDPSITMEEYIRLEEEKAQKHEPGASSEDHTGATTQRDTGSYYPKRYWEYYPKRYWTYYPKRYWEAYYQERYGMLLPKRDRGCLMGKIGGNLDYKLIEQDLSLLELEMGRNGVFGFVRLFAEEYSYSFAKSSTYFNLLPWSTTLKQMDRTTPKSSSEETPFSLTYGSEAVVPIEISMETKRIKEFGVRQNDKRRIEDLDILEERRGIAFIREAHYKQKLESASMAEFQGKMGPAWEGAYVVGKSYEDGAYKLETLSGSLVD